METRDLLDQAARTNPGESGLDHTRQWVTAELARSLGLEGANAERSVQVDAALLYLIVNRVIGAMQTDGLIKLEAYIPPSEEELRSQIKSMESLLTYLRETR